ncbi:hypothetical protein CHARACLAT_027578 [Characodon lateralis]|uniref:Uncharacterized protein n=1 Tax=Characodon lateralis TaxID=208331 RepID=A0ABU7EMT0_9TELE|nr:hypothetical protein [Characodon lateralis]
MVKHLFAIEEEEYERCARGKRFEKSRRESRRKDVTDWKKTEVSVGRCCCRFCLVQAETWRDEPNQKRGYGFLPRK